MSDKLKFVVDPVLAVNSESSDKLKFVGHRKRESVR
jgi:hypothetical protein